MKLNHCLIMNNVTRPITRPPGSRYVRHEPTPGVTVSVVMVVKGYPEYVFKTLESISSLAGEMLIGDIGIDDELLSKLKKIEKVKIVTFTKKVPYVELIRQELHEQAKGEYILVLDPDEVVPSSLCAFLESTLGKYDYVKIPRKNIIFGKWIEHSRWWPDYQVRFFKKGSVVWSKAIHSQPKVSGTELVVEPKEEYAMVHYNYKNLDEYLSKAPRYAKAEAEEIRDDVSFAHFSKKALSEFIGRYFADDGYKDGMHGFVLAFLQMMYYFLVYFYVWEGRGYKIPEGENVLRGVLQFFSDGLYEISFWSKKKGLENISVLKTKLHGLVRKLS